MNILQRLFGRQPSSKAIAKERLRLVLVHDRSGIPPELLQTMRDEMIAVISRHVKVDREHIVINLSQSHGLTRLVADIPIVSPRPSRVITSNEQRSKPSGGTQSG